MTPTREHIDALTTRIPPTPSLAGTGHLALVDRQQDAILQLLPATLKIKGAVPGSSVTLRRQESDVVLRYSSKTCRVPITDESGTPAPRGFFGRRELRLNYGTVVLDSINLRIAVPRRHATEDLETAHTLDALIRALHVHASTDPEVMRATMLLAMHGCLKLFRAGAMRRSVANRELVKLAPWLIAENDDHRNVLIERAEVWTQSVNEFAAAAAALA